MKKWLLSLCVLIGVLLTACTPQSAPASAPTQAPTLAPAQTVPVAKTLTKEEASWNTVVEAAKKEGYLSVYSYNMVGDVGVAVSRAFKAKYGITADIITGRGAEFVERVKTEKRMGRLVADVNDGSSVHSEIMKNEGLIINLSKELPVVLEEGVWRANVFSIDSKDKYVASLSVYYMCPWVNSKLVTPSDIPQVWRDLLKPQWKGKMVLTDPTVSGGPQQFFVPLMREGIIDEEFMKALYTQDLMFASSGPDEPRILARGERLLSIRGQAATYGRFVAEGAPIKAIEMKDGVVLVASPTMVVFNNSPHPNAARLYANWLLSKEGQAAYTLAASATPIRSDVPDSAPEVARLTPQRPVLQTTEDNEKAALLFRDRWPDKLWGRR